MTVSPRVREKFGSDLVAIRHLQPKCIVQGRLILLLPGQIPTRLDYEAIDLLVSDYGFTYQGSW